MKAGFTLLEVVVAMAILGLLAGSVFGILYQAGMTAGEIREVDQRDEEVSRFIALLRDTIEQMPQEGRIEVVPPTASESEFYEIKIVGATTAFSFGERGVGEGDTTIGLRPQPPESVRPDLPLDSGQQFYQVAISRDDFGPQDEDGDGMVFNAGGDDGFLVADNEGRYWLPILDYVTAVSFRFWDENAKDWVTEWTDAEKMPPLLELAMTDPYRPLPLRTVFDVPDHLTKEASEANSATTSTANSSTTVTDQPQGGGRGAGPTGRGGGDRGDGDRGGRGGGDRGGRGGRGGGDRGAGDGGGDGGPRPGFRPQPGGGNGGGGRPGGGGGQPSGGGAPTGGGGGGGR